MDYWESNAGKVFTEAVKFYSDGTDENIYYARNAWDHIPAVQEGLLQKIKALIKVGIPVWQIYAEAVGKSVQDVQKAISNGTISAPEFQKTFIKALAEGTDHFPALASGKPPQREKENLYRIVKIIDDKQIVINAGANHGISLNDEFEIFNTGIEVFDEDTKESLGTLDHVKARVTADTVLPKMSICKHKKSKTIANLADSFKVDLKDISSEFGVIKVGDLVCKLKKERRRTDL